MKAIVPYELVYQHENIFPEVLSGSIEVLSTAGLKLTDMQKYTNQHSMLTLNPGLASVVSANPALNN